MSALVPAIIVGILTFRDYKNSLEQSEIHHLQNALALKADKINTYFERLRTDSEIIQNFYNIKKHLPVLDRFAEKPQSNEFLTAQKTVSSQLIPLQQSLGLADIMLFNPKGLILYANRPEHYSINLSCSFDIQQRAFKEGKEKIYFSDIYFDKDEDNRYEMLITAPVFDYNDALTGIIGLEVDMTVVYNLIQDKTGLGKTGESVIAKKVGDEVLYLSPLKYEPEAALKKKIGIGGKIAVPIQNAVQGRTGAAMVKDYRGKDVIGAWTYFPSLGWGLATKVDVAEAFAEIDTLQKLVIVIIIIVIAVAGASAFSIAMSISRPIKKLSDGVKIVGGGNLNYQVSTNLQDEIGELSRSFDKMTRDLKVTTASRDELNKEIEERKRAEEELCKVNRTLKALSSSSQALMRSQDESQYLAEVCRIIDKDCGYAMVWIGLAENDKDKSVRPVAYSGFEKGYLETLKITWADDERGCGPTGTAIRTGKPSMCSNMLTDPAFTPWRAEALKRGYTSSLALPLILNDKTFGALTIYSKQPNSFSRDEINLLTELAGDLSYGIESVRQQIARRQAENALAGQRKEQEVILDSVPALIFYKDKENNFIRTNKAFEEAMGLAKDKLESKSLFDIFPKDIAEAYWNDDKEVIASRKAKYGIVETMPTPEGMRIVETDKVPYFDESGNVIGLIGFALDVTDRKKVELELRKSRDELEQRVKERTSELAETVNVLQEEVRLRTQAEKAIKAERKRFEDVLEMMPAYAVLLTPDYHVAYANRTFRQWFGNDNGKKCYEFLFNYSKPCENCKTYDVMKTGKSQSWEWTGPNGNNYDIYDYPFVDSDGSPLIMEIGVDVTDHKQSQMALRSTSLYARGLIEASVDPLVTISHEGKITDVNIATEEVTGTSRQQLIGSDFSNYFTEPQKAKQGYEQVLSEGQVKDYPLSIRHNSGRITDVLYNATVYRNEAGVVQGVFAAARDITQRKAAEEKQNYTNALLELFAKKTTRKNYLDSSAKVINEWSGCEFVGIRVGDEQGNIPYESFVGFDKDFLQLENSLHVQDHDCICIRTILKKSAVQERMFRTPGNSFFCNDSFAFLKSLSVSEKKEYRANCIKWGFQSIAIIPINYHNEILGAIHIADFKKDMVPSSRIEFIESTIAPLIGEAIHRFNAESELDEYRHDLEDKVVQRTQELARSNKDLEQFAYVASHDLQEPLRAVAGFTELLKMHMGKSLDAKNQKYMTFVVDGVVRMQTLIHGLLEYSRIGTRSKESQPIEAEKAVNHSLAYLERAVQESDAKITTGNLPTVRMDELQFVQLFQNLIGNAIKFRGSQKPHIHIDAEKQDSFWKFSVKDNGIGLEQEYAERIFLIFQRLHTRDKYPGTGIGLSICKKIVERHGGKIWVESQPGQGSTFYFTIPEIGAN
jgi:PAS domain S-box-containing protein